RRVPLQPLALFVEPRQLFMAELVIPVEDGGEGRRHHLDGSVGRQLDVASLAHRYPPSRAGKLALAMVTYMSKSSYPQLAFGGPQWRHRKRRSRRGAHHAKRAAGTRSSAS